MQNNLLDSGNIISGLIILGVILFILLAIFYATRFKKFKPNEYVIWLRRGKVKRSGTGGSGVVLPLLDELIVIPTVVQQTLLEAKERVVSREYQDLSITAYVYWRVANPELAFSKVSWVYNAPDYVEKVIKNAAESIIRTTCANMEIEKVIRERAEIIKVISSELHTLMADWGIITESVEIRDVEVLDHGLKKNLEATKKLDEEQKARLREAEMTERVKLRNLEVDRITGINDQEVKLQVESKAKEREIRIVELEQNRAVIAAETSQKQQIIAADAQKARRIAEEIDVEIERMTREAEARKAQLLAQADGEAAIVREKLIAEAEGLLKQVKAIEQSDERFLQLKTLEMLPEVFKGIKIDQMMLLGEGKDAFKSIAELVLPFIQIAKQMTNSQSIVSEKTPKK
ncbi:MAG: SPFH domain-containing protein [Candidatus Thorarchaeota archaeon]